VGSSGNMVGKNNIKKEPKWVKNQHQMSKWEFMPFFDINS
jgi:hypothetical protein